jgi:hypothetical protein
MWNRCLVGKLKERTENREQRTENRRTENIRTENIRTEEQKNSRTVEQWVQIKILNLLPESWDFMIGRSKTL